MLGFRSRLTPFEIFVYYCSSSSPFRFFLLAHLDTDKAFRTTITQMTSTLFSRYLLTDQHIPPVSPIIPQVHLHYPVSFICFNYHPSRSVNLIQPAFFIAFLSRTIFRQHRPSDQFLLTACMKLSTSKPARDIDPFPANLHAAVHISFS
jgi:hypothetical protein